MSVPDSTPDESVLSRPEIKSGGGGGARQWRSAGKEKTEIGNSANYNSSKSYARSREDCSRPECFPPAAICRTCSSEIEECSHFPAACVTHLPRPSSLFLLSPENRCSGVRSRSEGARKRFRMRFSLVRDGAAVRCSMRPREVGRESFFSDHERIA